jgi:5-methylcytosine-specific restriction endonuclease McrA
MAIIHQLCFAFADEKQCTRCGECKPLTDFHKQASLPGGYKHYCKACCKAINAARHAARPIEERRAHNKAAYAAKKDAYKARALRNYYDNPDKAKRRILAWNRANGDKRRVYGKRTRDRNPETHREVWRRRHARKMGTMVARITPALLKAKCAYWGNCCWICGGPQEAIDHVKPLATGGAHILANLRPICRACNTRKLDTWPYPTRRR